MAHRLSFRRSCLARALSSAGGRPQGVRLALGVLRIAHDELSFFTETDRIPTGRTAKVQT